MLTNFQNKIKTKINQLSPINELGTFLQVILHSLSNSFVHWVNYYWSQKLTRSSQKLEVIHDHKTEHWFVDTVIVLRETWVWICLLHYTWFGCSWVKEIKGLHKLPTLFRVLFERIHKLKNFYKNWLYG